MKYITVAIKVEKFLEQTNLYKTEKIIVIMKAKKRYSEKLRYTNETAISPSKNMGEVKKNDFS